jgi:hypothetical protein
MIRKIAHWAIAPFAVLAVGLGVCLAPVAANAAVSPVTVYNSNGEAGIYSFSAYPFFQAVTDTTPLTLAMTGNSNTPHGTQIFGIGSELCVEATGAAVQEGIVYNGDGTFDLLAEFGTLDEQAPDTASYLNAKCVSGGSLTVGSGFDSSDPLDSYSGAAIVLSQVPLGDTIATRQHQVGDTVYAWGEDTTTAIADNTVAIETDGHQNFDVAGIGTVENQASLSAPDTNPLDTLTGITLTSGAITASPDFWSAVKVVSNAEGTPADPNLVAGTLSSATAPVCVTTGHGGYWQHRRHHHRRWIRGNRKTVCTPGTLASLSLVIGSQVGA